MTTKEIIKYMKDHPSGKVKIAFSDIDGILRGKYISAEKFSSAIENGLGFCNVIFGWDTGDVVYDNVQFTGWHTGYPDSPGVLDIILSEKFPGKMMCRSSLVSSQMKKVILPRFVQDNC